MKPPSNNIDSEYIRNGRNLLNNIGIELEKLREAEDRHKPKYIPPEGMSAKERAYHLKLGMQYLEKTLPPQLNLDLDL